MKPRQLQLAVLLAVLRSANAVVARARHGSSEAAASHSSAASTSAVSARRYGPKHCVLVDRSTSGSCVIRTDCNGQDTSSLEFAFDCWSANGDIFRHSFGKGGFGEHEEFDTEVKCSQCHPPAAEAAKPKAESQTVSFAKTQALWHPLMTPAARAAAAIRGTEGQNSTKPHSNKAQHFAGGMGDLAASVSKYGPKSCVSTWRSPEGHCMVETACQDVDIASYEFGLICVDEKGTRTRHIFGRGSFDVKETFDTLAECSECVGLDDQRAVAFRVQQRRWKQSEEASEVATLSDEVRTLTQGMTSMLSAVMKLRQKVKDEKRTTPPPSVVAATATLAAWSGEDSVEEATPAASTPRLRAAAAAPRAEAQVAKKKHHHHHHHHHQKRRIVEDEEEDATRGVQKDKSSEVKEASKDNSEEQQAAASDEDDEAFTNGVGEPLMGESAESSELLVASDGEESEASAGSLDDGSSSIDAAW